MMEECNYMPEIYGRGGLFNNGIILMATIFFPGPHLQICMNSAHNFLRPRMQYVHNMRHQALKNYRKWPKNVSFGSDLKQIILFIFLKQFAMSGCCLVTGHLLITVLVQPTCIKSSPSRCIPLSDVTCTRCSSIVLSTCLKYTPWFSCLSTAGLRGDGCGCCE